MPRSDQQPEWYADGLRFECTQCGACCTGAPGYVGVTDEECAALAELLGLPLGEFLARHTHETAMGRSLNEHQTEHGLDCVFLDRRRIPGKAVCGVYDARPLQCRTFPWWPGNLQTPKHWKRLGRECEGVGRGGFVPIENIRLDRDRQAETDGSVTR